MIHKLNQSQKSKDGEYWKKCYDDLVVDQDKKKKKIDGLLNLIQSKDNEINALKSDISNLKNQSFSKLPTDTNVSLKSIHRLKLISYSINYRKEILELNFFSNLSKKR